jgi:hypothetical protein
MGRDREIIIRIRRQEEQGILRGRTYEYKVLVIIAVGWPEYGKTKQATRIQGWKDGG